MARESNAPTEPKTPGKANEQHRKTLSQQPEFGKPSPMGKPQHMPSHPTQSAQPAHTNRSSNANHLFNIPKANRPRVEHHRDQPRAQHQSTNQPCGQQRHGAFPGQHGPPPVASTPAKRGPFDPFKAVRSSAYSERKNYGAGTGATPIKRPGNTDWTTPRAPRPLFMSKGTAPKPSNASKNLQAFIDLTKDEQSPFPSSKTSSTSFGAMDVHGYVDSEKATENIKALLEGAFEDEEEEKEKSRSKSKSKKKSAKKGKSSKTETHEQSTKADRTSADDLDDLAAQLEGVTVNDVKPVTASHALEDSPRATNKDVPTSKPNESAEADEVDEDVEGQEKEEEVEDEEEEEEDDEEEDDDDGVVEGLKVTLLPHQVEGVKWMCDKETGKRTTKGIFPKGGILADDMGLGKTVQAIALMLRHKKSENEHSEESDTNEKGEDEEPAPTVRLSKSTLVVAPLALIKQWESEIQDKVERANRLRVCLYHGANRTKTSQDLPSYDVVITTYGTLTSEFGTAAADKAKKSGVFANYWYRIILDEAHTIKNRNAKATQAACALDAKYRWCLTGTPMQNNLDELQSLIKFLRIKPYNDLAHWRDQISRPLANGRGGLAIQRLQVYLKAFMKRRTKEVLKQNDEPKAGESALDKDGKEKKSSNGFKIVKREVIKVSAEFMEGEMNFYKRLEQRTENRLEEIMGGSKVDYAGALTLLLRLRQSCNHPDLVKSDLAVDKDVLLQNGNTGSQSSQPKSADLDDVADLFGALSVVAKKCDVCQRDLQKAETAKGVSRCADCDANLNTDFMKKEKRQKHKSKKAQRKDESPVPARFRKNKRVIIDSDDEDEEEEGEWIVPESRRNVPSLDQAGGSDDEDAEGGGDWIGSEDSETDDDDVESPTAKRKAPPVVLSDSDDESASGDESEDIYANPEGENGELPSTKIRHLMKLLHKEAGDHKFIVFSVFTSMLNKVEPFLKRANIGFARYDGQMRNDLREASLNKLRNNSGTRVLLCSLRAGALGLNLTAASRVVILEPFWNPFVEEQAIDRVHRLNQTVDVKIYRMIIKGTVEERIVELQDRKRELANMTIEGKTAAGKLTMRDMMALFGRDAEHKFQDKQGTLDFKQPTRLLSPGEDHDTGSATQSLGRSEPRDRPRQPASNRSKPEDSVYGRRW
ncbi:Uncharacterized protein PECH_002096 [Penicillium ucsense]|uniref:SNF2 family helicase/ATPase n=1 Tax=Penicillium ucsense TaxID=2839758 RepID=A0A8J8W5V8_9EURO|nr:Uncharacterized protein PECM_002659 [Penicillium ucsense]KAF7738052.1 Uncharacterized protein PECH_002096 [Penicillium ucsense]